MEKSYTELGNKIKELRKKKRESLKHTVEALHGKATKSFLSKLENGKRRPSVEVLNALIQHFSVSDINLIKQLFELAGYATPIVSMPNNVAEVQAQNLNLPAQTENLQIVLPPNMTIAYTDSAFITASNFGIVFDFAQSELGGKRQTIVGRIGMSYEHAKMFSKVLKQKLEEGEVLKKSNVEKKSNSN